MLCFVKFSTEFESIGVKVETLQSTKALPIEIYPLNSTEYVATCQ